MPVVEHAGAPSQQALELSHNIFAFKFLKDIITLLGTHRFLRNLNLLIRNCERCDLNSVSLRDESTPKIYMS